MDIVYGIDVSNSQPRDLTALITSLNPQPTHVVVRLFLGPGKERPDQGISRDQIASAQANGCTVSGYWWQYDGYDARDSVHRTLDLAASCGLVLPMLWVDIEPYVDGSLPGVAAIADGFDECDRQGVAAGIYTGEWVWPRLGGTTAFSDRPLWTATYNGRPDLDVPVYGGWGQAMGHQYSDSPCDLDVFDVSVTVIATADDGCDPPA